MCYSQPGALQIEHSEESDQGKYECVATNNDGTRYSAPANLYVRGRKHINRSCMCISKIIDFHKSLKTWYRSFGQ